MSSEEIKTNAQRAENDGTSWRQDVSVDDFVRWYIFRYKTLPARIKDKFCKCSADSSFEIFSPYRRIKKINADSGKVEFVERPAVPGYIFVRSTLETAAELSKSVDLPLWKKPVSSIPADSSTRETSAEKSPVTLQEYKEQQRKRTEERKAAEIDRYYTIPDPAMHAFIRAVELNTQDIKLLDASDIDLQKDDEVEITAGDYKGTRGFLKVVNGKSGGVVVVPLNTTSSKDSSLRQQQDTKNALLYYGIPVQATEIAILSFAKGSRRATDQLNRAKTVVDDMLASYIKGDTITSSQRNRLLGYIQRYRDTQFDRPIQRANLGVLLYRIYSILELYMERDTIKQQLVEEIFPDCLRRIEGLRERDRKTAQKTYQSYLDQTAEAEEAYEKRSRALNAELEKK